MLAVGAVALLLVLLRVPSLVEPPQFTDEGTYADIGWGLDHGAVLYRDVWDNKPPGIYWLAAALNLVRTSVFAYHLFAAIIAALATAGVWLIGRHLASDRVGFGAATAFAVLVSLPTLAGDVLNAEGVGALLSVLAVLMVISARRNNRWRLVAAGALAGAALLCKATFVADVVVVTTLPLWMGAVVRGQTNRGLVRASLLTASGAALVVGGALLGLALGGSLNGFVDVLLHQDLTYLQQVGIGGVTTAAPPPSNLGATLTVITVSRTAFLLLIGAVVAAFLARRRSLGGVVVVWWLAWDLAAMMFSARGLVQYVQQAEPALCLGAALAIDALARHRMQAVVLAAATTVAAWALCIGALLAPMAEVSLVESQPLAETASADVAPRAVTHVLGRGWERVLALITEARYDAGFASEPARVRSAVTVIDEHSSAQDRVFVWGVLPWVYALSGRLAAGQYVALNAAYRVDADAQSRLIAELRARPPVVLVAIDTLPDELTAMLQQLRYRVLPSSSAGETVWLAPNAR